MSISIFKKAAAAIVGAATIATVATAAIAAAADKPVIYADQKYAEPGEIVDFSLNIESNTGYAASGIGLYYDERVEPQGVTDLEIEGTLGEASTGLAGSLLCNTKKLRVGWTSSGTKDNTTDGAIYTVRFKVPEDAQPGDTFNMQVVVTQFCNAKSIDVDYEAVDGWIKIKDVTTTSETTTTVSETTTTVSETTTTVSETTTTVSSEETTTVSSEETTTVSEETTTVSEEPGTDAPSESSSNGNNDQPGVNTGDAGIALAIAGLLTAAGAAVVIRRKH